MKNISINDFILWKFGSQGIIRLIKLKLNLILRNELFYQLNK